MYSSIIVVVLIFLFGGYVYIRRYEHSTNNPNNFKVSNYQKTPESIESTGNNQDLISNLNDKEKIHYKLLNSIDYFKSVEGEIHSFGTSFDNVDIKYIIDKDNNRSVVYSKSKDNDLKTVYNNFKCVELDFDNKEYRNIVVGDTAESMMEKDKLKELKPGQRYNSDGSLISRSSNILGRTDISIYSLSILSDYMKDYDKWSINGSEMFIGRNCTKIEGIRHGVETRSKAEKYIALIDTETGIVLKYDEMNSDNEVVNGFETKYIKFDEAYDETIFSTSTEGYVNKVFEGK